MCVTAAVNEIFCCTNFASHILFAVRHPKNHIRHGWNRPKWRWHNGKWLPRTKQG